MSEGYTAYPQTAANLAKQLTEALLDHEAFEQRIRPCELDRCRATCCHDGVYLSQEESQGIQKLMVEHKAEFDGYAADGLRLPGQAIISTRGGRSLKTATRPADSAELAEDYPAHFPKTRCVFLDQQGRCGIQMLSVQQGRAPWFDKPLTCWIHPIVILPATRERSRPLVTLVSPENDPQQAENYPGFASCTHCGRPDADGVAAKHALSAELAMLGYISGRDILAELHASGVSY